MRRFKFFLILSIFFILSFMISPVSAATLHGDVYDLELNKVDNAIVEVDSEPRQRVVSKEGEYSFELSPGEYNLIAYLNDGNYTISSTAEPVSIKEEGDFVLDLILFPGIDDDLLDELNEIEVVDVNYPDEGNNMFNILLISVLILIVIIALFVFWNIIAIKRLKADEKDHAVEPEIEIKKNKGKPAEEEPGWEEKSQKKIVEEKEEAKIPSHSDLDKILDIIKKEGGRTTQKEIRKKMPYSEAKISLMISELEHNGMVERIKKGRGNIIVLKD
ncbi:MAG: hypothetical protein V1740_07070 [Candidatus Woesearchaeota archaeon]